MTDRIKLDSHGVIYFVNNNQTITFLSPFTSLTRFDFLIVLIGIFVGMALSKIVGFAGLILSERHRFKLYWVPIIYLLLLFVAQVHYWWSLWQAEKLGHVGFFEFLNLLILPVTYYLCSAILCPDYGDGSHDLKERFKKQSRTLFGAMLFGLVVSILQAPLVWGISWVDTTMICRYVAIAIIAPQFLNRGEKYHEASAIVISIVLLSYLWASLN